VLAAPVNNYFKLHVPLFWASCNWSTWAEENKQPSCCQYQQKYYTVLSLTDSFSVLATHHAASVISPTK